MNQLVITQPTIIDYSKMLETAQKIKDEIAKIDFKNLVITDGNKAEMKKLRADINRDIKEYESQRIALKTAVMKPYDDFEKVYKQEFFEVMDNAQKELGKAIAEVEEAQKQEKIDRAKEYFEDMNKYDFLSFDRIGLKIGLTTANTFAKNYIDDFLAGVEQDLNLIATQPYNERILVEYHRTLNASTSIQKVLNDVKAEEELKARLAAKAEPREPIKDAPVPKPVQDIKEPEELITITFTVTGTKSQLIEVREFMKEKGIKYE